MTDVAVAGGIAVATRPDQEDEERLAVLTQLVDQHAIARRSLIEQVVRILLGLWSWDRTMDDPVMVKAAVAATILYVDEAMEASRLQERAFVQAYAEEMGVRFSPSELRTEPIYPRNADMVEVYTRVIEEYRWQRYGRVNAERSEGVPGEDRERGVDAEVSDPGAVADAGVSLGVPDGGGSSVEDAIDELAAIFDDVEAPAPTFDPEQWEELERLERQADEASLIYEEEAFQKALARLEKIVTDDVNLAAADEHRQLLEKKRLFLGYRRVIHPEMSESGTCGLCVAASTRIYSKRALLPMHSSCKCTVMGVAVDADPARAMNLRDAETLFEAGLEHELGFTYEDLLDLYALAAEEGIDEPKANGRGTSADELRQTRFEVIEHGELGPRLSAGRGRQDKPFVERTYADSRAMWARTIEWAEEQRSAAVKARDSAQNVDDRAVYGVLVTHYTSLITRLTGRMSKKNL